MSKKLWAVIPSDRLVKLPEPFDVSGRTDEYSNLNETKPVRGEPVLSRVEGNHERRLHMV
jgi:hypothetical protein